MFALVQFCLELHSFEKNVFAKCTHCCMLSWASLHLFFTGIFCLNICTNIMHIYTHTHPFMCVYMCCSLVCLTAFPCSTWACEFHCVWAWVFVLAAMLFFIKWHVFATFCYLHHVTCVGHSCAPELCYTAMLHCVHTFMCVYAEPYIDVPILCHVVHCHYALCCIPDFLVACTMLHWLKCFLLNWFLGFPELMSLLLCLLLLPPCCPC